MVGALCWFTLIDNRLLVETVPVERTVEKCRYMFVLSVFDKISEKKGDGYEVVVNA